MQNLEQRLSQLVVGLISCIFLGRFFYYYAKAPELLQQDHPGFVRSEVKLSLWDRVQFAWQKANTGR